MQRALVHCFYQVIMTAAYPAAALYLLYQRVKNQKYRGYLLEKLGLKSTLPRQVNTGGIWLHAVSMGEMKAALALYRELEKKQLPIYISATTTTGLNEAKRLMPKALVHFLLPLDHALPIQRLVKKLKPSMLVLIESDFWWNLIEYNARSGAQVFVASGKLSDESFKVYKELPFFFRALFAPCKLLCLQTMEDYNKFASLGIDSQKLEVTGNLKIDTRMKIATSQELQEFKNEWNIPEHARIISLVSTHENEEKALLNALQEQISKDPNLHILIAPRHPERFAKVKEECKKHQDHVTVITALGQTSYIYALSQVCIVGGSFFSHLQGHNILEPVFFGVPVLFGPYMSSQKEFLQLANRYECGIQTELAELANALGRILEGYEGFVERCKILSQDVQGSSQRTFAALNK